MSAARLAADGFLLLAIYAVWFATLRAGLPVLGGGAFVAVGGYGLALLGPGGAALPLGLALLLGVALAGAVGWLVGFGATRLDGSRLALATWALAWLVAAVLAAFPSWTGGAQGLTRRAPVHLVSQTLGVDAALTPTRHLLVVIVLVVVTTAGLARVLRGPAGADLAALTEGPAVAAALGVPVAARRRSVLVVAAALAGLAGAGGLMLQGVIAPGDVSPLLSVQLFAAVLIGGRRLWGPWLGVAVLAVLPTVAGWIADATGRPRGQIAGVVTAALLLGAVSIRGVSWPRRWSRSSSRWSLPAPPPSRLATSAAGPRVAPTIVVASGLHASYGTLQVLSDVDLQLRPGQVHAVLGPNGSGKTTLLRLLAGSTAPQGGSIVVDGHDVTGGGEQVRVRAGVARTFQRTVLLGGLSPRAQVEVGARVATARPLAVLRHLIVAPSAAADRRRREGVTTAALAAVGLVADPPAHLVTADQRLLQIARVIATGARVLLLDEPGAGMTVTERASLADTLRQLAARGYAVLLVEHDLALVAAVADWVTVLSAGRVIARGPMDVVRQDPDVVAAYLGVSAAGK